MAEKRGPLFLERSSYRKRRLMDALKLLVFLGIVLWMIPTLWPDGTQPSVASIQTSTALFYIFGVWVLLIALAALFQKFQRVKKGRAEASDRAS